MLQRGSWGSYSIMRASSKINTFRPIYVEDNVKRMPANPARTAQQSGMSGIRGASEIPTVAKL
jgi:hypothetical protein